MPGPGPVGAGIENDTTRPPAAPDLPQGASPETRLQLAAEMFREV